MFFFFFTTCVEILFITYNITNIFKSIQKWIQFLHPNLAILYNTITIKICFKIQVYILVSEGLFWLFWLGVAIKYLTLQLTGQYWPYLFLQYAPLHVMERSLQRISYLFRTLTVPLAGMWKSRATRPTAWTLPELD